MGLVARFSFPIMRFLEAMEIHIAYLSLLTIWFQALMYIYDFRVSGQISRTSRFEGSFRRLLFVAIRLHVFRDL